MKKLQQIKQYFSPQLLKTFASNHNSQVQLVQFGGSLRLDMGGLTQSGWIIQDIWSRAFKKLLPQNFSPTKVLILGFGAGSAAKLICHKWPGVRITALEIDPVVIKIAKQYFGVDQIPNLKILNQDAIKFVQALTAKTSKTAKIARKGKFDLVLVDCYQGNKIPPQLENIDFLGGLKKLSPVTLINRLYWNEHKARTDQFVFELKAFRPQTCRTPSNLIIRI